MIGRIKNETGIWQPYNGFTTQVRKTSDSLEFWDWNRSKWVKTDISKIDIFEGQIEVFVFEGTAFLGNLSDAYKRYEAQNPSKKFFIWLQDNYPQLKLITK